MSVAPDPRRSYYVFVCGIKGSGKSEYCRHLFHAYPYDRLVIDTTHDVTEQLRRDGVPHHQIMAPIPGSWPEWMRDPDTEATQMTLVFRPDMGSEEALADIDRCIGMSLRGKGHPTLVWCDEIGSVCTAHKTGPGMHRALHHGRHHDLSLLMAGPEARNVNPLCIAQADRVVIFRMLNKDHREVLARNMGADQAEFDAMNARLGKYEHMVWERDTEELEHMGPLPLWRPGRNIHPEVP